MNYANVPQSLIERPQWVLWKIASRASGEKPTKLPFQVNGNLAKANDSSTWTTFEKAKARHERGGYAGLGYEFSSDDPFCGIDLDGCRSPTDRTVAEWAREIIKTFYTYAEVSPSLSGVKLFIRGKLPMDKGQKKILAVEKICDKEPAIEVYDRARYFAVTGMRLIGPPEPQERQEQLDALLEKYFPTPVFNSTDWHSESSVIERARQYVAKMPPAVSGQDGHGRTFHVACVLILGFGLPEGPAMMLLKEYNQVCDPPWSERELQHKLNSAMKQTGERNYLRNASLDRWDSITLPAYAEESAAVKPNIRQTTLLLATQEYVARLSSEDRRLIPTGIPNLDGAIGGGVEYGEMVIIAGRPSHGKSMVAMQMVHHWTSIGHACLMISEEMSATALGKRTLQFATDIPEEHWAKDVAALDSIIGEHFERRSECYIAESCGSMVAATEQIENYVAEHGVKHVIVDYAQLLRSAGKSRYEQVTATSIALRTLATKHGICLIVLCQLNREIEKRTGFCPTSSDLKDTGQLEQDADVIVCVVWPHRISHHEEPDVFHLYVTKNRNRAIVHSQVTCHFVPTRQMLLPQGGAWKWDDLPEKHTGRDFQEQF